MKIWLLQIPRLDDHYSWGIKEIENLLTTMKQDVEVIEINHAIYENFFNTDDWLSLEDYGIVGKADIPLEKVKSCILKCLEPIKSNDIVLSAVFSTESRSWFTLIHSLLKEKFGESIVLGAGGQGCRAPGEQGEQAEWSDWILGIGLVDVVFLGQATHTVRSWVEGKFTGRGKKYLQDKNFPPLGRIKPNVLKEDIARTRDVLGYWTHDANDHEVFDVRDDHKDVSIHFTQGCVKKCVFCDVWKITPDFVMKKPEEVIEEINHYNSAMDINHLLFPDNTINSSDSSFLKMLELLYKWKEKNNRHDITWSGQFAIKRKQQQKDEMFELITKTKGNLSIGFDHASDEILSHMKKLYVWEDILYFIKKCTQFDTDIHRALWMVGYPTETQKHYDEYQKLINLVEKPNTILAHHVLITNINKGSELESLVTINQNAPNDWYNNIIDKQTRIQRKKNLDHSLFKRGTNYLKHRVSMARANR